MTKKDKEIIRNIVIDVLNEMLYEDDPIKIQGYNGSVETMFQFAMLDKMEDYLGCPIDFMGIS